MNLEKCLVPEELLGAIIYTKIVILIVNTGNYALGCVASLDRGEELCTDYHTAEIWRIFRGMFMFNGTMF